MPQQFDSYKARYRAGDWRSPIFCDMVLEDLGRMGAKPAVLDIGCGAGFDGSLELQEKIAAVSGKYIGIEPDTAVQTAPCFNEVHRSFLVEAPVPPRSIDLAYAVMVVEHVSDPGRFLAKVAEVLRDGGVFWAFTVDLRHWAAWASLLFERLKIKERYLNSLIGERGVDRYENYPVHYRLNTPGQVARHAKEFSKIETVSFHRIGQEDYYLPKIVLPLNHGIDRLLMAVGAPGSNVAFRAVKRR
jgi:SAM-dependent methyltransferase